MSEKTREQEIKEFEQKYDVVVTDRKLERTILIINLITMVLLIADLVLEFIK